MHKARTEVVDETHAQGNGAFPRPKSPGIKPKPGSISCVGNAAFMTRLASRYTVIVASDKPDGPREGSSTAPERVARTLPRVAADVPFARPMRLIEPQLTGLGSGTPRCVAPPAVELVVPTTLKRPMMTMIKIRRCSFIFLPPPAIYTPKAVFPWHMLE